MKWDSIIIPMQKKEEEEEGNNSISKNIHFKHPFVCAFGRTNYLRMLRHNE